MADSKVRTLRLTEESLDAIVEALKKVKTPKAAAEEAVVVLEAIAQQRMT